MTSKPAQAGPADPDNPHCEQRPSPVAFYVVLGAVLLAFIQTFALLAPILLSFLLILLISLAVNPLIIRLRSLTGGRKVATGLVAGGLVLVLALTGLAFFGPMKTSVTKLSRQLPAYWERLQKPLIKLEKQAVMAEEKLQAEVSKEMAVTTNADNALPAVKPVPAPESAKKASDSGPLRTGLKQTLQALTGSFKGVAFNAAQIIVVLVTVFFGVLFTLMNPRPILGAIFLLVPARHHERAATILQRIAKFLPIENRII